MENGNEILGHIMKNDDLENLTHTAYNEGRIDRKIVNNLPNELEKMDWRTGREE